MEQLFTFKLVYPAPPKFLKMKTVFLVELRGTDFHMEQVIKKIDQLEAVSVLALKQFRQQRADDLRISFPMCFAHYLPHEPACQ
jgi:hypothetical protein